MSGFELYYLNYNNNNKLIIFEWLLTTTTTITLKCITLYYLKTFSFFFFVFFVCLKRKIFELKLDSESSSSNIQQDALLFYIICLFFAVRSLNPNLCATRWLMFLPSPPIINNQIRVYSVWVTITVPTLVWTASWVSGYSVISVLCASDTPAKAHCIIQSWDNEVWRKKDSLQSKTLQTIECVTVWKPSWHFRYTLVSQCQPTCLEPLCCTVQKHFLHSRSLFLSLH